MGVVARLADRVGVIYAGSLVEEGTRERLFLSRPTPTHRA